MSLNGESEKTSIYTTRDMWASNIGTVWACWIQSILIEVNFLWITNIHWNYKNSYMSVDYLAYTKILTIPQWIIFHIPLEWTHFTLDISRPSNRNCSDEVGISNPIFSNDWSRFIYEWYMGRVQWLFRKSEDPNIAEPLKVACLYKGRTYICRVPQTNTILFLRKWALSDFLRFNPSSAIY